MFQNLKVDVVYYNTNTDFEMEFNLCGCCRMRLLTDKTLHKKGFLQSLSRAVSRSKVIMVVGKLFGDNGIINMSSAAIRSKLVAIDNKKYGIDSAETIEIIDGALPLVTPEGFFGGCIVENGPQTMILISENKNIRKSIMKTLIHPYLEELCANGLKEKAASAKEENESAVEIPQPPVAAAPIVAPAVEPEVAPPVPVAPVEPPVQEEEVEYGITEELKKPEIEEPVVETEKEIELDGGMIYETDQEVLYPEDEVEGEESDLFVKPFLVKKADAKKINFSYFDFEENEPNNIEYGEFEDQGVRKTDVINVIILILAVLLLLCIAAVAFFLFVAAPNYGISAQETIKEVFGLFSK